MMRKVEKRSFKFCAWCHRKFWYVNDRQLYCAPRCRISACRARKLDAYHDQQEQTQGEFADYMSTQPDMEVEE